MRKGTIYFIHCQKNPYFCIVKLRKLTLLNFKNIPQATLAFEARVNCLVGANGAGKTNVLEALHYLSMCKGAMGLTDTQNIRHGEEFFLLEGTYEADSGHGEQVSVGFQRGGGKVVKRGEKEYERLADHIGCVPLVGVFPSDIFLVSDPAEERRRYLNGLICQMDRPYLEAVMRYNTALAQRNSLLKGAASDEMLDVLDLQLTQHAGPIFERRAEAIAQLAPLVADYYAALSGDTEQVELAYRSELSEEDFAVILMMNRQRDRLNRFTTAGIHRDEVVMRIGGHPLKKYGSQGQQKSFLVALKLAQYQLVRRHTGEHPLLLLDDLFDKLDAGRVERLLELVTSEDFGQIFITDCDRERLEGILRGDYTLFEVVEGEIK